MVTGSIQIKKIGAGTTGAICRSTIIGDIILEKNVGITTVGISFPAGICTLGNFIHGSVN